MCCPKFRHVFFWAGCCMWHVGPYHMQVLDLEFGSQFSYTRMLLLSLATSVSLPSFSIQCVSVHQGRSLSYLSLESMHCFCSRLQFHLLFQKNLPMWLTSSTLIGTYLQCLDEEDIRSSWSHLWKASWTASACRWTQRTGPVRMNQVNPELVGQVLMGSWLGPKALSQILVQKRSCICSW